VFEEHRCLDILRLRRETSEDHQAVERLIPLMHQGLNAGEYVHCLKRLYGVVAAWEEQAALTAPEWLRKALAARERRNMLDSDLACFGHIPSEARSMLPPIDNLGSLVGAMYVMEGSTLGGQLIARHVERCLGLNAGFGDAYFLGHGNQTGHMWKEFCLLLETKIPESDTEFVVQGAKAMFATFGTWMKGHPAQNGS
jgi:heme oxygenase